MAHLVSIAIKPPEREHRPADHYTRVSVERAVLEAERGIVGDAKASRGKRQLNVMLVEMVEQLRAEGFRTAPGELGEQLVISGLSPELAAPGVRLRLGDRAVILLGELREPCDRFARIQGSPEEIVIGRIGYMARVLVGGEIAVGSPVDELPGVEIDEPMTRDRLLS